MSLAIAQPQYIPAERLVVQTTRTVDAVSSVCFLGAIALLAVPVGSFDRLPRLAVIWTTFFLLLAMTVDAYLGCRKRTLNPWASPVFLISAYYCYRYGWGSVVANYWHEFDWVAFPEFRYLFHRFGGWARLPIACHIILLFALGMYIGLRRSLDRPSLFRPIRWNFSEPKLKRTLVYYMPIAVGVASVLQFNVPLSIRFAVGLLGDIVYPAIALVSYWACTARTSSERTKWIFILVLLCLGSIPVGLQTGQIAGLLRPGAMAVFGYAMAMGRLPMRVAMIGLPLFILLVVPFLRIYKGHGYSGMPITQRLQESAVRFDAVGWHARTEISMERLMLRWAGANMPAVYSRYYPSIYPYEYGTTFGMELRSLVPRVISPDKGYGSYELNRYSARVGLVRLDGNTTALFDALSEYYLNFGLIGVFVLSVFHGYYFAGLHKWLVSGNALIGVAIFGTLLAANEDFYGTGLMFISHVKIVPIWLMMFYFFSRVRRERV